MDAVKSVVHWVASIEYSQQWESMEKIKTIDEHGSKMDFQNEKLKKLYVNYSNAFDAVGIHAAQNARMQFSRVSKDPRRAGSSQIRNPDLWHRILEHITRVKKDKRRFLAWSDEEDISIPPDRGNMYHLSRVSETNTIPLIWRRLMKNEPW